MAAVERAELANAPDPGIDWRRAAYLLHVSRALDDIEEKKLVPERKIFYQFSARGHDLAQILLGLAAHAQGRRDLRLLPLAAHSADARRARRRHAGLVAWRAPAAIPTAAISARCSTFPIRTARPRCRCAAASARSSRRPPAGRRRSVPRDVLGENDCDDAIGVVLGGDASVATNGFWSALTIATTLKLPMLFYIEDNGFGISVPSRCRRRAAISPPIWRASRNLHVLSGDGTEPAEAAPADRRGGAPCARAARAGAAPPYRSASRRPFLPGHANLQIRNCRRRRTGARSAAEAARLISCRRNSTSGLGTASRASGSEPSEAARA